MIQLRRRLRRSRRWSRPLLRSVFLTCLLLLVGGVVLGVQAFRAKGDLESARTAVTRAQRAVAASDVHGAETALAQARTAASRAQSRTTGVWGPLWGLYGELPGSGRIVREARGIVHVTYEVTTKVLPPLVDSVGVQGKHWDGRVDVASLRGLAPRLTHADSALTAVLRQLAALPYGQVDKLDRARERLNQVLTSLAGDLREASVAAQVLPGLLGADHPGHLLVVAQNLAEERATGGLMGSYAILQTDAGAFSVVKSGSVRDLSDAAAPVVDLGPEFARRYGRADAASTWRSANLSPDVPTSGSIFAGLAQQQLRVSVDGVLFIDPVGLSYLLEATGPISLGRLGQLDAANAPRVLLHDVYDVYPTAAANGPRDAAFQRALLGVVDRLRQARIPLRTLVSGLRLAARSGHLSVYASARADENLLRGAIVGGALPTSGPFLSLVTQDVGGSKLDYYLHRAISYEASPSPVAVDVGAGPEDEEAATVTVTLRNDAPAQGLPPFVTFRADLPGGVARPVGQLRSWVSVYLGPRASYSSATLNGRPLALTSETEQGLAVFSTYVDIDPGTALTLVFHVRQPAGPGSVLLWRQQPRLEPDELTVRRGGKAAGSLDSYYAAP